MRCLVNSLIFLMETVSDLLIWKYALYVFESICLLLFRKDLMLTQVMPYCNQAPHTIFKIKCEELYFKEMWKHKISWKWCMSFAFIWWWEIMCQNLNLFEWIQWYYWHENQMLTYLNESNSINESNNIKVHMHRNFWKFFYCLIWKTVKNQEVSFLPFVDICFRSRDMSFQSLRNLEKKCDKKIEHFVPL